MKHVKVFLNPEGDQKIHVGIMSEESLRELQVETGKTFLSEELNETSQDQPRSPRPRRQVAEGLVYSTSK